MCEKNTSISEILRKATQMSGFEFRSRSSAKSCQVTALSGMSDWGLTHL